MFLDHRSAKFGDKTFEFLIVLDGGTSITFDSMSMKKKTLHRKSLLSFMDAFQMNPKAICALVVSHQPCDMQAILSNAQCEETCDRTTYTMAKPS